MEVKINKEIREYTESIFFGLSLRQFFFSVCACISAIILHFALKNYLMSDVLSLVCIIGAIPFAVLGFYKYNGMTAEKFVRAFIKSEILTPKRLLYKPKNLYYELLKESEKRKKRIKRKSKKKEKKQSSENIK